MLLTRSDTWSLSPVPLCPQEYELPFFHPVRKCDRSKDKGDKQNWLICCQGFLKVSHRWGHSTWMKCLCPMLPLHQLLHGVLR
jgi:hypothetical protein